MRFCLASPSPPSMKVSLLISIPSPAGPSAWNSLPPQMRTSNATFDSFKSQLKTCKVVFLVVM